MNYLTSSECINWWKKPQSCRCCRWNELNFTASKQSYINAFNTHTCRTYCPAALLPDWFCRQNGVLGVGTCESSRRLRLLGGSSQHRNVQYTLYPTHCLFPTASKPFTVGTLAKKKQQQQRIPTTWASDESCNSQKPTLEASHGSGPCVHEKHSEEL